MNVTTPCQSYRTATRVTTAASAESQSVLQCAADRPAPVTVTGATAQPAAAAVTALTGTLAAILARTARDNEEEGKPP